MKAAAAAVCAALAAPVYGGGSTGPCTSGMNERPAMDYCMELNRSVCEAAFDYDEGMCQMMPFSMSKANFDQWKAGVSFDEICAANGGQPMPQGSKPKCEDLPQARMLGEIVQMPGARRGRTQQMAERMSMAGNVTNANGTANGTVDEEPETPEGPTVSKKEWCGSHPFGSGRQSVWAAMEMMSAMGCCVEGTIQCSKPSMCGDPTQYQPDLAVQWDCVGLDSAACSGTGFEYDGGECKVRRSSSVPDPAAACSQAGGSPRDVLTCKTYKASLEGMNDGNVRITWDKESGSYGTSTCEYVNYLANMGCCGSAPSVCNARPEDVVVTAASAAAALEEAGIGAGLPVAGVEVLGALTAEPVIEALADGVQELLFTFAGAAEVTESIKSSFAATIAASLGVPVSRCSVVEVTSRVRRAVPLAVTLKVVVSPPSSQTIIVGTTGTTGVADGDNGTQSPVTEISDIGTTYSAGAAAGPSAAAAAAATGLAVLLLL